MATFNALFGNAVLGRLTSDQADTLLKGGVAARLEDPRFMTTFDALLARFTTMQVVKLTSDSFAARLKDPRCMTAFNALFDRFTSMQAVLPGGLTRGSKPTGIPGTGNR